MKRMTVAGLSLAAALGATAALAMPPMILVFRNTYKNVPAGTALSKAGCAACHVGNGPKLNPYGDDLKKAMAGGKALTPAMLKKVEKLDSDKDGAKNGAEIKKGTLPGDPKSK